MNKSSTQNDDEENQSFDYQSVNRALIETTTEENRAEFRRKVRQIDLKGATITFRQVYYAEKYPVVVQVNQPLIQMRFTLTGNRSFKPTIGYGPVCPVPAGHHALSYYPKLRGETMYLEQTDCFAVDIALSTDYLRGLFHHDLTPLRSFGKAIDKQRAALMGGRSYPITPAMKNALLAMYHCSYPDQLKALFMEGKLLELLVLQVEQIYPRHPTNPAASVNDADVEKLHTVRKTLHETMANPPSITDLALLVGMNRTKLMKEFRALFGNTIYGYLADLRMEEAKALLVRDGNVKIAEVARLVGFGSPTNFSIAFRKKFGFPPSALRQ